MFNNVYGRNGSYVTAGQQDYAERMNQIQTQKEAYYKKVGVAPGVPTEKGAYGDPENTGVGYNAVLTELGNHDVPQGWIQTPHPNTTPGTNPGPPVSWNDPTNPDDPQAGYGYIANDTTKEETFFYHSDHLGSTSYITDDKANITQYDAYLPYGELLVDEHSSSEDLSYKFNGKQFDEETGLYYYGARYLNPVASIWYGVDPLAEKYQFLGSYVYCSANPIKIIDVDGNDEFHVNGNGNIIKVVNNNSANITIVSPDGSKKYFSDYETKSIFLGWGNGKNRQIIANVAAYYAKAIGIKATVGTIGEIIKNETAHFEPKDNGIWIPAGENGTPDILLKNKYNLMNTLFHEDMHFQDYHRGMGESHFLHASVVSRASSHWTFARTTQAYKGGQAIYFSQLAMNAYYNPPKDANYTKQDVLKLISNFNKTNKGNIRLYFDEKRKIMNISIDNNNLGSLRYKRSNKTMNL